MLQWAPYQFNEKYMDQDENKVEGEEMAGVPAEQNADMPAEEAQA